MGIGAGLAYIGTTVAGWVGVTGIGAITAAVIGGAIVGAAIGGLTAAITDGDIGKGMLFGAIGGAVTGGVSAYASGLSSAVTAGTESIQVGAAAGAEAAQGGYSALQMMDIASGVAIEPAAGAAAGAVTTASTLESVGLQVGVGALSKGVSAYLAADMAGEQAEAQKEANDAEYEKLLELQELKGQQAMEQLQYTRDKASAAEQMTYDARMAELDQRQAEFDATMDFNREQYAATQQTKADRQALFGSEQRRTGAVTDDETQTTGIYDTLQATKETQALVS